MSPKSLKFIITEKRFLTFLTVTDTLSQCQHSSLSAAVEEGLKGCVVTAQVWLKREGNNTFDGYNDPKSFCCQHYFDVVDYVTGNITE